MITVNLKKTSINVNDQIWREAKIQAIKEDIEVSQLVQKALQEYIGKQKFK